MCKVSVANFKIEEDMLKTSDTPTKNGVCAKTWNKIGDDYGYEYNCAQIAKHISKVRKSSQLYL